MALKPTCLKLAVGFEVPSSDAASTCFDVKYDDVRGG
jgi:hypothetical protein